jgi:hypothetical protein
MCAESEACVLATPLVEMVKEAVVFELEAVRPESGAVCTVGDIYLSVREWYGAELDAAGIDKRTVEDEARLTLDAVDRIGWDEVRRIYCEWWQP